MNHKSSQTLDNILELSRSNQQIYENQIAQTAILQDLVKSNHDSGTHETTPRTPPQSASSSTKMKAMENLIKSLKYDSKVVENDVTTRLPIARRREFCNESWTCSSD